MFGTPPSTPCSNDCGCSIREGDRVSLVIVYTAEGLTEAHDIHCRNCNLPEPSDLKIGEWAGYVTGTAAPNKWVGGGGDCLTVDDATITKIEAVPGA